MSAVRTARVSEQEFLSLPESMDKIELIDGEVIVSPAPTAAHQTILQRIVLALLNWARTQSRAVTIGQSPWDIRFGRDRILQPDAFVLFGAVPLTHEGPLDLVPEICIEVLWSNRVHDRVTKRFVYAGAGVKEYWIVDLAGVIEQRRGPGLAEGGDIAGKITSPLLPGFELALTEIFRPTSSAGA